MVKATSGGTTQTRERQTGGSYLSAHDHRLHFGLGTATSVDLEIRWPDGEVETFRNVTVNSRQTLQRGAGAAVASR